MNAESIIQTAATENGFMPGLGLTDRTDAARDYLAAWLGTVDHGCGHAADVSFTRMPHRSVVCPSCARQTGLLDRPLTCGRCYGSVDLDAGGYAVMFASGAVIVMAALCRDCLGEKEPA